ncbi:phosphoheptose isomerase family protein [Asaia astilbis]|uniref:hypothetical protein n=1 Tax=Asaia astilbis TaxID=610244 RepID=UPI0006890899|nr:hypothetical protein [Asaia astilbis]
MTMTQNSQKAIAIQELAQAVDSIADADIVGLAGNILKARNVVCFGAGREGLMMRGFTMRLFHAGITANYIADMTCPALGQGDLLVVAIGPGTLRSVETYATIARDAGATIICITAQPEKVSSDLFDQVIEIKAQTMASDQALRPPSRWEALSRSLFWSWSISSRTGSVPVGTKTPSSCGDVTPTSSNPYPSQKS